MAFRWSDMAVEGDAAVSQPVAIVEQKKEQAQQLCFFARAPHGCTATAAPGHAYCEHCYQRYTQDCSVAGCTDRARLRPYPLGTFFSVCRHHRARFKVRPT